MRGKTESYSIYLCDACFEAIGPAWEFTDGFYGHFKCDWCGGKAAHHLDSREMPDGWRRVRGLIQRGES